MKFHLNVQDINDNV